MALHLHRARRADVLADGLAGLLATPLPDPFATEVVVVPARGMERWLSQRLSHVLGRAADRSDGVCAGVEFRTPWSLVAEISGTRDDDPWSPDSLAWPVLDAIDDSLDESWAAPLALHLGHGLTDGEADLRVGRRYAVARRVAGLFASYAVQRLPVLESWSACRDDDGCGGTVPADLAWQPPLWRRVVARVGAPPPHERHRATVARLRDDPGAFDLPERVSLFGHTRIPTTEVRLLAALGEQREVHLWLPHPSEALWDALAPLAAEGPVPRADDRSFGAARHPLLVSLARDVRELQRTLADAGAGPVETAVETPAESPAHPDADGPDTLLGWLQADLAANTTGASTGASAGRHWTHADRSLQVHACHGPARQVEVLREVLLGLLAADPTLEPRDILVMCPDIESYAPLVQASFGLADVVGDDGHPAHQLRVRLADRALHQTNPLLSVAGRLLDLAGGRAPASQVLDLAHAEPVRRRFRFTDDDLDQLATWVSESGVRWGFDAEHRRDFGLDDFVQNTWRFGLDRLLAGVTMSADAATWIDKTLPIDDVGSGQVDLVGRLAEYVDRLVAVTDRLVGSHPLAHWLEALGEGVATLTDVSSDDAWQAGQVQRELSRIAAESAESEAAGTGGGPGLLRLPDVRALLGHRLAGRPTRANFRTGTLTVCTMVPMRSVPHRVVCLLGLDDGVFPRVGITDGDDLLARDPMTGERDLRSEDRQLLLDAVLAATETLVVTYTGADAYSGQRRPPAVPLGELLDALDDTATAPGDVLLRDAVVTQHPLQPFDPRNVTPGALVPGESFSFDPTALAGARASVGPRTPPAPFLPDSLPPLPTGDVALDDLATFLKHPVKGFLRGRLDLALPAEEELVDDGLPVEIDQLAQWGVGDRVLTDLLAGVDPGRAREQEWRRGVLPPGRLGWRMLGELVERAVPLARATLDLRTRGATAVDIDVDLGDGRWLRGTVPEVYGDRLVRVSYSRLGATHRLQSWLLLLALSAADPDHNWTAHTIGRPTNSRSPDAHATSLLGPIGDYAARDALRTLVDLRDRGLEGPLPLPVKASFTYAKWRRTDATVAEARRRAGFDWDDGRFPGECSDAAHVRVWGPRSALPATDTPPRPGEEMPGETGRFGALALRLWGPLLDAEQGELVMTPTPPAMETFDVCGPLPTGTTLLEASAGTGKTFTVAGLVTRYVAEGHARLEEMLVITFGRAASQELRERVRAQLVEAERALTRGAPDEPSALITLLLDADADELHRRGHRLREALASFDAATIATTHQFCQLVLRSLGVAGDTDPGVALVDNLDELVVEVVDDLYLQRFGQLTGRPPFSREEALTLAYRAVGDPQAHLVEPEADPGSGPAQRVAFAHAVRAEIEHRKRRLGILSYDDLLSRLADALEQPDAPARQRMRDRWRLVLVDEFQDTDPVQWQVIDRAFTGHATVVLIGDPKQAIYAFRGGDVVTYLTAARTATTRATLGTNWRSDQALVERLQVVLQGAALGDDDIVVREVTAATAGTRLAGLPRPEPFRLRAVRREGFRLSRQGDIYADRARAHIAADCAADIAETLAAGATFEGRPLEARDVAVLVARREHGRLVQEQLAALGIASVVAGGGHVLLTPAADEWLALLEALDQPHRGPRVRAAAITAFFGETTTSLVTEGDPLTDRVADTLRGWALLLRSRGVAALVEAAEERGLTARVLRRTDGDRLLTDLRHVGQLLHEVATRDKLGLTALLQWFREERVRNAPTTERTRRLDSDAAAVQIVTVHASKGLQYPIVYLPFAFEKYLFPVDVALFHDADGTRTLDVAGAGRAWSEHVDRHQAEEAGEELRELYVALTRAQSQVVCWWAPTSNTAHGGLHRLLFGRQPGEQRVPDRQGVRDDDYAARVLGLIEQLGGPAFEQSVLGGPTPAPPPEPPAALARRRFDRPIDTEWRRTSYSGLIRAEEAAPDVASEPEVTPLEDEPETVDDERTAPDATPDRADEPGADVLSPMAELPAGAAFGSLVHAVLEHADPHAPDLRAELLHRVVEEQRWWPVAAPAGVLADALVPLHDTPLGPLAPGLTLRDLGRDDRLCELDFEFPLAGGDVRGVAPDVRLHALADAWRRLLPADDPLAPYADRLEQPVLGGQRLRGYLSGSIDVVLRIPGAAGPRFVVADYKTNLLGEPGRPPTAADYAAPRLAEAMLHSHYPLQATLYSVVLHRYLRWRLPGYSPERHLGGVLYLYLRGMCGPETPVVDGHPAGVFSWAPPAEFVVAVSDLLAAETGAGAAR